MIYSIKKMKKVIIQDTDPDLLETLTIVLKEANFEVLPIPQYKDVVSQIDTFSPNLILLDFKLSGQECSKLCQRIKLKFPAIPVIALSCNINIHNEYAKSGFDNFIEKPFDLNHMIKIIHEYITA